MMKMEFDTNGFSTSMGSENEKHTSSTGYFESLIGEKKSFLFGLIAIIISAVNLPFGLFMNFSTKLIEKIFEIGAMHWITVLYVFSILMIAISVSCGVFSIISYAKSKKTSWDTLGFLLSIFSFVIGMTCLILNIIGITIW